VEQFIVDAAFFAIRKLKEIFKLGCGTDTLHLILKEH
jgi:hypothetical protein